MNNKIGWYGGVGYLPAYTSPSMPPYNPSIREKALFALLSSPDLHRKNSEMPQDMTEASGATTEQKPTIATRKFSILGGEVDGTQSMGSWGAVTPFKVRGGIDYQSQDRNDGTGGRSHKFYAGADGVLGGVDARYTSENGDGIGVDARAFDGGISLDGSIQTRKWGDKDVPSGLEANIGASVGAAHKGLVLNKVFPVSRIPFLKQLIPFDRIMSGCENPAFFKETGGSISPGYGASAGIKYGEFADGRIGLGGHIEGALGSVGGGGSRYVGLMCLDKEKQSLPTDTGSRADPDLPIDDVLPPDYKIDLRGNSASEVFQKVYPFASGLQKSSNEIADKNVIDNKLLYGGDFIDMERWMPRQGFHTGGGF